VLRIEKGAIGEILTFGLDDFASFGLAPTLEREEEPSQPSEGTYSPSTEATGGAGPSRTSEMTAVRSVS
jgi:hypothetical protein